VPEVGDETLRERFVYSYRVIYRVRRSDVRILAVVHGRRLLDSVVDRFR
jgi:plasmid stabilization system protein ParE